MSVTPLAAEYFLDDGKCRGLVRCPWFPVCRF